MTNNFWNQGTGRASFWYTVIKRAVRQLFKRLIYFPVSPFVFKIVAGAMRAAKMLPPAKTKAVPEAKTVLVCHPYSRVGDLVLLLPFMETLRRLLPHVTVDIVVGASVADLLDGLDGAGRVFRYEPPRTTLRVLHRYARIIRITQFYKAHVGRRQYDLAIAPRWGSNETYDSHYLAFLTGAPIRCGYSATVDGGDPELDGLLTVAATGGSLEHESLRNINLLVRGKILPNAPDGFQVDKPIRSLANLAWRMSINASRSGDLRERAHYGIVSPGATKQFCIWPKENMIELIDSLSRETGFQFYVVGGQGDTEVCDEIEAKSPGRAISLGGKTTLPQLVSLLAQAAIFVGNDSGTAHIAGGLGVPTFVIHPFPESYLGEHPNSPKRFRPCGPNVHILQPTNPLPPCHPTCNASHPHCIRQISVGRVLEAVRDVISNCASNRPGMND